MTKCAYLHGLFLVTTGHGLQFTLLVFGNDIVALFVGNAHLFILDFTKALAGSDVADTNGETLIGEPSSTEFGKSICSLPFRKKYSD